MRISYRFLTSGRTLAVVCMTPDALPQAILQASGGKHPLDVAFAIDEEDVAKPWENQEPSPHKIAGPLPPQHLLPNAR
jgi:hypothetical protein